MKRTRSVLCWMLLVIVSCFVLQVNSTEHNCHVLCQRNKRCKTRLIGNSCYVHFDGETKTWDETKRWCLDNHMTMVNLPNDSEASAIAELMKFVGSSDIWLGGKTVDLGRWTYVNGNPLNTEEFPLFHYVTSSQSCGVVKQAYENGQRYNDLELRSCNIELPYFCRSETNLYHGLYYPMTSRKNWFGARQICRATGGDLFYTKEGETVGQLLNNFTKVEKENVTEVFFIGLRREKWKWQDGREVYNSNWNYDEQEYQFYQKNCLMLKGGKLSAEGSLKKEQVICQKELLNSTYFTQASPTISDESEISTKTPTTQTEQPTSAEASTPMQGEELVTDATFCLIDTAARCSLTTAYFTALGFLGGSLLLLAVAFPLIPCWIKKRRQTNPNYEGRSEHQRRGPDVRRNRNTLSGFPELVNPYEDLPDRGSASVQGDIGRPLSYRSSSSTPPPLPDVSDLPGAQVDAHCPEPEQHYKNRTAIMAARPRKPKVCVADIGVEIDSLQNLLEYCEQTYGEHLKKSEANEEPNIPEEYVDMKDTVCSQKQQYDSRCSAPGSVSHFEDDAGLQLKSAIESLANLLEYYKENFRVNPRKLEASKTGVPSNPYENSAMVEAFSTEEENVYTIHVSRQKNNGGYSNTSSKITGLVGHPEECTGHKLESAPGGLEYKLESENANGNYSKERSTAGEVTKHGDLSGYVDMRGEALETGRAIQLSEMGEDP